jgi:hypothetical protein
VTGPTPLWPRHRQSGPSPKRTPRATLEVLKRL